jgi:hypothetical protein
LISAAGIQRIFAGKIKVLLGILLLALGLAQFFGISYNAHREGGKLSFLQFESQHHGELPYGPPLTKDPQIDAIADSILKHCDKPDKFLVNIGVMCDDAYGSSIYGYPDAINYSLAKKGIDKVKSVLLKDGEFDKKLDFIVNARQYNIFIFISKDSSWPVPEVIKSYFIDSLKRKKMHAIQSAAQLKYPGINKIAYNADGFMEIAQERFKKFLDSNKPAERVILPGGYFAFIYAKKRVFIERGLLKLTTDNKSQYIVQYQNADLMNLRILFDYRDNHYNSSKFDWQEEKISPFKLTAKCEEIGLPFVLVWELEIVEDNKIDWQIKIRSGKEIKLSNIEAKLYLSPDYKDWISLSGQGKFSEANARPDDKKEMISLIDSSCLGAKAGSGLPGILFESIREGLAEKAFIGSSGYPENEKILGFSSDYSFADKSEGGRILFHGQIDIFDSDQDMYARKAEIKNAAP